MHEFEKGFNAIEGFFLHPLPLFFIDPHFHLFELNQIFGPRRVYNETKVHRCTLGPIKEPSGRFTVDDTVSPALTIIVNNPIEVEAKNRFVIAHE